MAKLNSVDERRAVTIIELLAVIAILAVLAGLLFPAIGSSVESARRVTCTSRVRQVCLGMNQILQLHNDFPTADDGTASGWAVVVLSNLELDPLASRITDVPLVEIPDDGLLRPLILSCPSNPTVLSRVGRIQSAHIAADAFRVSDVPLGFDSPWLASPEILSSFRTEPGPHRGGFMVGNISDTTVRLSN